MVCVMTATSLIRVVLVDDHRFIHEAVQLALKGASDILLVGQGSNGQEAVLLCQSLMPDVVLMDIMMPIVDGITATRQICQEFPQIKIIALSSFQDDDSVSSMLNEGAHSYVMKAGIAQQLLPAIRATHSGVAVLDKSISDRMRQPTTNATMDFGLTARELEVLKRMAAGMNNGEIAQDLFISVSTVKFHVHNICLKMSVETRMEAVVLAARHALV